jgi:hypothetical protein
MILWPLLYLAVERNLREDLGTKDKSRRRMFPFDDLWENKEGRPVTYDRAKLLGLIKISLQEKFSPASPNDRELFERMCHICSFMCAHDPNERKMQTESSVSAAEQCLNFLNTGNVQLQQALVATPAAAAAFDPVCKFIDNFCASGHFRGSSKVVSYTARWRKIHFKFSDFAPRDVEYENSPEKNWLFVNRNPVPVSGVPLTFEDCLTPDYLVLPPQELVFRKAQPRAIFLPRNKFCSGIDSSTEDMFDPACLTLLTQRDWFTVFRYERPNHPPWIIKSAPCARHRSCCFVMPSAQTHCR